MSAEEIQREMAAIRRSMSDDIEQIRDSSGTMLDWRYYFKQYPWPMVTAATVAGYFIVPRRIEVRRPDPEMLAKLARNNQIMIKEKADTKPEKGLAAVAFGLLANALLRAGTAYVGQQAGKVFGKQAAEPNGRPHAPNTYT
jgi:hypothetical protein